MGWYHVNKIGKGICLGDVDGIHYNEDFIEKHTPTKGEALELKQHDIRDDELEGYEAWPLYKKWISSLILMTHYSRIMSTSNSVTTTSL